MRSRSSATLRVLVHTSQTGSLAAMVAALAEEGYEVSGSATEAEALSKFQAGNYDLLLLSLPPRAEGEPLWMLVLVRIGARAALAVPTPLAHPLIPIEDRPDALRYVMNQVKALRESDEARRLLPLVGLGKVAGEERGEGLLTKIIEGLAKLAAARAWLLALDESKELRLQYASAGPGLPPPLVAKMAQRVVEQKQLLRLDLTSAPAEWQPELAAIGGSGLAFPLKVLNTVAGALVFLRSGDTRLGDYESQLISLFLPLISLALENQGLLQRQEAERTSVTQLEEHLARRMQEIRALNALLQNQQGKLMEVNEGYTTFRGRYLSTLRSLVNLVESGAPEQLGPSEAVANWMVSLAPSLGLGPEGLAEAAYLHDLGMLLPQRLPWGKENLAPSQQQQMLRHPFLADKIAEILGLSGEIKTAIKYHHENYDGSGYPDGLAKENIPLAARLLRVVDDFVALTSLGEKLLSRAEALAKVRVGVGREYDPQVVEALAKQVAQKTSRPEVEMISTVSHELRSPLTFLVGYSELLAKQEGLPESAKEKAEEIYSEAVHMSKLVEDLLNISRYEAGRVELRRQEVDLAELIKRAAAKAKAKTSQHQVEVRLTTPTLRVKVDPDKLLQVLDNLLDNAINYSPNGGQIVVSAEQRNGETQVSVADQGIGIPKDKQSLLFEKFYRVDSPLKDKVAGTGLGLSLCQHIVNSHGGRIWVESEESKGSTFTFSLPT